MVQIAPYRAWHPTQKFVKQVASPPYDVLSYDEALALSRDNPHSFLHVTRPDVDVSLDASEQVRLDQARRAWQRSCDAGVFAQDATPCLYVWQMSTASHCQTGLSCVVATSDYETGSVRKHELTRPDKEDDRTHHIDFLKLQTGNTLLMHRSLGTAANNARDDVDALCARVAECEKPFLELQADDCVAHRVFRIQDTARIQIIQDCFERMPLVYIADGHHRTAGAARVAAQRATNPLAQWFVAVTFSHTQMKILPYHRVVLDVSLQETSALLTMLRSECVVEEKAPSVLREHQCGFFVQGIWYVATFPPAWMSGVEHLDVVIVQKYVLSKVFHCENPRTDARLQFVGGSDVVAFESYIEKHASQNSVGIFMHPTPVDAVLSTADAGGIMPPKSTWFHPKLRDGLLVYAL